MTCAINSKHGEIEDGVITLMCETEPLRIPFSTEFRSCNPIILKSKELYDILNEQEIIDITITISNKYLKDEDLKTFKKYWGLKTQWW